MGISDSAQPSLSPQLGGMTWHFSQPSPLQSSSCRFMDVCLVAKPLHDDYYVTELSVQISGIV